MLVIKIVEPIYSLKSELESRPSRQKICGTFVLRKSSHKKGWKSADVSKGVFLVPKMPLVAMTEMGLELIFLPVNYEKCGTF